MTEFKDSTRRQILDLIKKSENGMTTEALCKALQVTTMAVHRQLAVLQSQGLVTSKIVRHARGRPTYVYTLTEAADQLFPQTYAHLLLEFLEDLLAMEGVEKIRKLFERQSRKFIEIYKEKMRGKDLPARVDTVREILDQHGYITESERLNDGKFLLKLYNCPIPQVAQKYPDACACEQGCLSELVQAEVVRDHHRLAAQNYCSYIISETVK